MITKWAKLAAEHIDGRPWYAEAQAEIVSVCKLENWPVDYFTAVLAVTSPRVSVRRNLRIALQYCHNRRYLANVMRGIKTSVITWETRKEILGPKTSAFYAALKGDKFAVVLDTHMAGLFGVDATKAFRRKKELAHWTNTVCTIAEKLRIYPAECQACLWFGHKRSKGENPEAMPILGEYSNWLAYGREFPATGYIPNQPEDTDSTDYVDDTF